MILHWWQFWSSHSFLGFPQASDAWIVTGLVKMEGHAWIHLLDACKWNIQMYQDETHKPEFPGIRVFINSAFETHWKQTCVTLYQSIYMWLLFICWVFRGWGEILISCLALKKQNQCCSLQMLFACVVYTDGHLWFLRCSASSLISCTC